MKQRGFRYCSTCKSKLQKWGKTLAGTQRWRCPSCTNTQVKLRPDLSRAFTLERFVTWLLGKQSQAELNLPDDVTDRTWRDQTAWCWSVAPYPEQTGEVHPVILLDGIGVGSLVCLVARTPEFVIGWCWVGWESSATWAKLLQQFPPPTVVVCDGQKGIVLALARCWPQTRVQRCLFHIWQNIRVKLTLHPLTEAGRELLQLTRDLWQVKTPEQAASWQQQLEDWHERHGDFIRERTDKATSELGKRRWWYTHGRLRSAYYQLAKLLRDNQLFTHLEPLTDAPIPRTTNYVEGGINSQLRTKLKLHRGMSEEHQRRLVEWYLYSRTEEPKPTRKFL
ncbi:IS1249 family transposase [Candidatus Saccharibacteria bacterium]|nr:IS1249 family transposase [Candidatus Saccharibacteria bacterium]